MQTRYQHQGLTWVDLEDPDPLEVRAIAQEFGIDEATAEQLLLPVSKPRTESFAQYLYVVMHFPALKHSHTHRMQEIDFVVGKDFLVTAHYEGVDPLHKFAKQFEVDAILQEFPFGEHAGHLFFFLLRQLYRGAEHELEAIRDELRQIEEHIFRGHEVKMVTMLSRAARALLNVRHAIEPHREVLRELEQVGPAFFGDQFQPFVRVLSNEYYRVHNHVMRETESVHELRETNNSLLSTKQNETMRVLTIMAFMTFPLALVSSLFGMNTKDTPIVGMPHDFWIVLTLMLIVAVSMLLFFHHKRWL